MKFGNDLDIFLDLGWVSVRQKNHKAAVVELTFLLALQMKHSCPVKKLNKLSKEKNLFEDFDYIKATRNQYEIYR